MLNPRALALAVVATGAGAVLFLSTGQEPANSVPTGGGPVPVAIPPVATEVPTTHPAVPAVQRAVEPSTAAPAPSVQPTPKRATATPAPTRKAAPKPKRSSTPAPSQPPAYSEMDLGGGWTAYCSNGYLQPDGSCTSQPGGYHPPAASDPCSGTGTECLNATLGQLGIYNGIPGLMGGR